MGVLFFKMNNSLGILRKKSLAVRQSHFALPYRKIYFLRFGGIDLVYTQFL